MSLGTTAFIAPPPSFSTPLLWMSSLVAFPPSPLLQPPSPLRHRKPRLVIH